MKIVQCPLQNLNKNMNKNNQYLQCTGIIIYIMKIFGIFPFIFSHRGTSKRLTLSRIITIFSIVLYILMSKEEILYIFTTINLLIDEFNFIIFIRFAFCLAPRIILTCVPAMTWRNSEKLYTLWKKWQNYQKEIEEIKRNQFILPTNILFWSISMSVVFASLTPLPFKSYFKNYEQFAASIYSFYYLGVLLVSITFYWFITCLFFVLVAKELQRLIEKALRHEQYKVILRLLMLWFNLYEWKKEFISAHSNLFLIFIISNELAFITSIYSMFYMTLFKNEKLMSFWYLLTALFNFFTLLTFSESANYLYTQIVNRIQEILLSKNITKINTRFLKQMETFFLAIEVHKTQPSLNEIITLNRSTILTILAVTINYLIVVKQFHH